MANDHVKWPSMQTLAKSNSLSPSLQARMRPPSPLLYKEVAPSHMGWLLGALAYAPCSLSPLFSLTLL